MCWVRKAEEAGRAGLLDSVQSVGTGPCSTHPGVAQDKRKKYSVAGSFFFLIKKNFFHLFILVGG